MLSKLSTAVYGNTVNKTKYCSLREHCKQNKVLQFLGTMLTKLSTAVYGNTVNKTKNCSFWEQCKQN